MTGSVGIVSTSVNPQPKAYAEWAKQGDLIVAGDRNSPRELEGYVKEIGGTYLDPHEQDRWAFSASIGWNCIQRRNAAVMEAYARRYDYVVTVDDDNWPTSNFVAEHIDHIEGRFPPLTYVVYGHGGDDWVDTGQFMRPPVRQRGVPLGAVTEHRCTDVASVITGQIDVSTAQVLGDPDCDAIERITRHPVTTEVTRNVVVAPYQWSVFNSQATVWRGSMAPLIACLPFVGRYDDIIASLITKRIMSMRQSSFYCGVPCVRQDRNEHDLVRDLAQEVYGMSVTRRITDALGNTNLRPRTELPVAYIGAINALDGILPIATINFMRRWVDVWTEVMIP